MINKSQSLKTHVSAWIIFGLYEVSAVAVVTGTLGPWESYLEHYPINILLFYLHCRLVLPFSFKPEKKHKILTFLPLLVVEVLLYMVLNYVIDYLMGNPSLSYLSKSGIRWPFFFSSLWRAIYFIGFATTYFLFLRTLHSRLEISALEKQAMQRALQEKQLELELADSRNAHLKAQVNPHFLMNTLSFIYNKSYKSEPHTADAVFYLSKILRFMIEKEHGPGLADIGPEIEQVENLFELCRIKDEQIFAELNYSTETESAKVIPLILLTLAENMIKHGNLSEREFPGVVRINQENGRLTINTSNLINTGINDNGIHSGLKNIAQRLKHTYGAGATITHQVMPSGYFHVEVILPLSKAHKTKYD